MLKKATVLLIRDNPKALTELAGEVQTKLGTYENVDNCNEKSFGPHLRCFLKF